MARPRVFVSSTYYDLKHLRSSIENFIEQLGYEPVLSEKDSIAYLPDTALDESCYREARSCDLFVLIIGGRYGSAASNQRKSQNIDFYEKYESITNREYDSASERDIPTYILIDASVDAEYQTYLKNKDNKAIKYAHVDSVNIFGLIESIREKQKNNPVKLFSKYSEIEGWLKEQWAGTFRELIHRMSTQHKIQEIDSKILDLTQTAETLKRYMEEVVSKVSPEKQDAIDIIRQENERLKIAKRDAELKSYRYIQHLMDTHKKGIDEIRTSLSTEKSYHGFLTRIFKSKYGILKVPPCACSSKAFEELNGARQYLDLNPFPGEDLEEVRVTHRPTSISRNTEELLEKFARSSKGIVTSKPEVKVSPRKMPASKNSERKAPTRKSPAKKTPPKENG
ncbi:DUF4062 domain-containing protein [Ideonella dechloratans]|uniref:DUF4062 domain-containing protein n=1 Tax=Ideonella dechloratans TaxID=36863 RepID=A0A643FA81_IDEDE|nr:DUF4062 domain-containing protein [Ideonella dechloratans]KAB0580001.1 DUF4062 domain-containing protein [Ideonella dechloratans]UFU10942.1 DUF4062 domain-containing protein [Ideonella dechloratans]